MTFFFAMAGVKDFLGSWREEAKEGYDEMAEALGKYMVKINK